jgi:hypothetical protein
MKKIALALLVALGAVSCDSTGPEPEGSTFLAVECKSPFPGLDQWVFATNENGELLDAKRVEDGVELKTTTEFTSFDLSILNVYYNLNIGSQSTENYNLTTYRNLTQNKIVLSNGYNQSQHKVVGQVKVKVTGIPKEQIYSSQISVMSSLGDGSQIGGWTYTNNSFSVIKLLAKQPSMVLVTGLRSGIPVYHIFDNVSDGDPLTVNFYEMTAYHDVFTVGLTAGSSGSISCLAYADNDQSVFSLLSTQGNTYGSESKPLQMKTIPGFAKYKTSINTSRTGGGVNYIKKGAPVTSYTPPDYFPDVTDPSIKNLTAEFNLSHDYRFAEWMRQQPETGYSTTIVRVYSNNTSTPTVQYEIPPEIAAEYPSLSFDKLNLSYTIFYRSLGTYKYTDFIAERFNGKIKSQYELYEFVGY